eukprot:181558-Amphidinium_carterae.2
MQLGGRSHPKSLQSFKVLLLTVFFCYFASPAFRVGHEYFTPRIQDSRLDSLLELPSPNS